MAQDQKPSAWREVTEGHTSVSTMWKMSQEQLTVQGLTRQRSWEALSELERRGNTDCAVTLQNSLLRDIVGIILCHKFDQGNSRKKIHLDSEIQGNHYCLRKLLCQKALEAGRQLWWHVTCFLPPSVSFSTSAVCPC